MENPDYDVLLAIISGVIIMGYCLQEILFSAFFTQEEIEELRKNRQENQKDNQ